MNLRDYQEEAIEAILKAKERGVLSQVISLPCGCGKTICFATLAKRMNVRTLIIAHTDELITQAIDKMKMVWPEVDIGKVKAEVNEYDSQIVVASIQSAQTDTRLYELKKQGFGLVVIDECHHATANSYRKLIEALEPPLLVGFTATVNRGDKVALADIFEEITYEKSLLSMIENGYLVDIKGFKVLTRVDLSKVRMKAGDFAMNSLSKTVNTEARNNIVVNAYKKRTSGKPAIAFCADVKHARDLAAAFRAKNIPALAVYGDMPLEERRSALAEFEQGKIKVLTNCQLLTEGFDAPWIEAVLLARPTKSTALYIQMLGRGTRLYEGKEVCTVIDFSDSKHDVCALGGLAGKQVDRGRKLTEVAKEAEEEKEHLREAEEQELLIKEREFDLLQRSLYQWFPSGEDYIISITYDLLITLRHVDDDKYVALVYDKYVLKEELCSIPFDLTTARLVAEDYLEKSHGEKNLRKTARWRTRPASSRQKDILKSKKIVFAPTISSGDASDLISQMKVKEDGWKIQAATIGQKKALKKKRIKYSEDITKKVARQLLYSH